MHFYFVSQAKQRCVFRSLLTAKTAPGPPHEGVNFFTNQKINAPLCARITEAIAVFHGTVFGARLQLASFRC